ncbi:AbrB/MazE/SpoVT family DNA-binding domain-containing protein [Pseudomonas viridiflava]|uniref:AbrB/MazE/SpoVT family DNA-binding domain-containing protein n=1 Tax=Pseudomonas viridiflava TaxID=33069 RepID=UPI000F02FE9A|nr:AbrB/MazE/SpoVT family DNA-binding domain-containing protein [Pseudomonas viridiflava]
MAGAILNSKGRVTIPAQVRESLGLRPGDKIEFVKLPTGDFAVIAATRLMQDLKGLVRKPVQPVDVEDMNRAIAFNASGTV